MEQIVTGRISSPQTRRPGLPGELCDIIMRALATDRERRYATADDLRIALDQFAIAAGLTASSSSLASYMRQQFGQRPEPWLEQNGQPSGALDDVQTSIEESVPSNSWTELPRLEGSGRRASTSSIPIQSQPLPVMIDAPADATARMGAPQRPSFTPLPSAPPATDSRMGWENQPRAPAPRVFPMQKAAMVGGGLALGIAIWLIASMMRSNAVPVQAAVQPAPPPPAIAQVTPPAAAAAQPATEMRPATEVVATGTAGPPPDAGVRSTEPAPSRKPRSAPPPATVRTVTRTTVETPAPPSPKTERPTRVAAINNPEPTPRPAEISPPDTDLHRPAAAALPPPPPLPQPVTPPVVTPTAPSPAVAPPAAPQVVAPAALDANRISGEKSIAPDEPTMDAIARSGENKLISTFKVCITPEGGIGSVTQLKSTGFPAYDTKIQNTIRKDWRYKPYLVNGKATAVCTAFRFIYAQK
jgi:hypothetical protein